MFDDSHPHLASPIEGEGLKNFSDNVLEMFFESVAAGEYSPGASVSDRHSFM